MNEITWANLPDTPDTYAHGIKIHEGMAIVDYDYRQTTITRPVPYGNPAEPQWFYTANGGMVDASRIVKVFRV